MNKENRVGLAGLLAAAPESGGSPERAAEHARNRPGFAPAGPSLDYSEDRPTRPGNPPRGFYGRRAG
jgi:hypothetical protein